MSLSPRYRIVLARLMQPTPVVLVVLTFLWALFFWRLWTPEQADRVIFEKGDFPLHYFAFADYQVERMWDGDIPLWNPYNYGGDPFAANVQWAVWYPPRWVAALLAGPGGWSIEAHQFEVAFHYWLASVLLYAFLRVVVRHPFAALAGSVLYAYGGYMAGYPMLQPSILYAIVWLPLALLGIHLSVQWASWRVYGIVIAAGALALSFLGGHTQTTTQMAYLSVAYLVFRGWYERVPWRGGVWRVILLGGLAVTLAAVQLVPAFEMNQHTFRSEAYHYAEKSVGFTAGEFVHFLWPTVFEALWWPLYLGVAGLLLALGALARPRREHGFWLIVTLVALWLSFGGNSIVYDFFYVFVPLFDMFREQERAAALAVFALVTLAAYQIAWLFPPMGADAAGTGPPATPAGPGMRRQWWLARGHLALTASAYGVVLVALLVDGQRELRESPADTLGFVALVSALFYGWLLWRERTISGNDVPGPSSTGWLSAGLIALIVVDLFSVGVNSPNFVPDNEYNRIREPDFLDVLQQDVRDIAWHVDGAAGLQTYGTYWRIPDIYGTGPFRLAAVDKLRGLRVDARWEVFAVRYATMFEDVPDNVALETVGEGINYDDDEYLLYELLDPRPFAHLVYDAVVVEDDADARFVMNLDWANLRETAVLTGEPPLALPGTRPAVSRVQGFQMTLPEYIEMGVSTDANALLTLPIAAYPGWRAEVNGESVEILTNYAGLIAVPVPAGADQKVTLAFRPVSVVVGAVISAGAVLVVLAYGGIDLFRRRKSRRNVAR